MRKPQIQKKNCPLKVKTAHFILQVSSPSGHEDIIQPFDLDTGQPVPQVFKTQSPHFQADRFSAADLDCGGNKGWSSSVAARMSPSECLGLFETLVSVQDYQTCFLLLFPRILFTVHKGVSKRLGGMQH